jgi:eukaryotic-like serine/threonine-protein kinase
LLALAAGLAESLSAIHAAGVVHRDLKPSNVLLGEDGPRVIDFGISEAAESVALTGADVVIGSPGFMSPEQVLGHDIGPPSDMFSLGAVLAFAGTGQGPFGSGSNAALVYRVVNSPASLARLPVEVRPLVGSCLAKHPGDRPNAGELLAVVGAIQPARGWLSESIIYGSAATQSAADLLGSATAANARPAAGPVSGQPEAGNAGRHARRRLTRPLASAGITCGVVVASAAAVIFLTGAVRQPPAQLAHPQVGATVTGPAASSSASVTPSPSSSASGAVTAPNAYVNPSLSQSLSPSSSALAPSSSNSPSGPASPSASGSSSASPSASPSPSSSGSGSASPSPSPSASPSPSPSSSPTPSASPSASPTDPPSSPTDSPSASASATSTGSSS